MNILLLLLQDMFIAAIPAVGFAILFNVPPRALVYCATLGALGHGSRTLFVSMHIPLLGATFFGAAMIGFIGVWLGRRIHSHPKVFTVAAIIPMIPGVYAYRSMIALLEIQQNGFTDMLFMRLVENLTQTIFLLGALVCGLALPGLLFYRDRPIV